MFKDYTILIIDDDIVMQEYLKYMLQDHFKELFFADDGAEGLSQYQKYKPDVVITDLNMPIMSGITMSKYIKDENAFQPIILMSAYGDIPELREAINIGLNAFLSKPIENKDILFNTIQKLLDRSSKSFTNNDLKAHDVIHELLHDDQEYVDYESLIDSSRESI